MTQKQKIMEEVKRQILFLFCALLLTSCIGHYKDFDFKKKLANDFYLAQSNILPSKYVCIAKDKHHLIIVDDVIGLFGNTKIVIIKTLEKESNNKFYKINFDIVEYPEDIIEISYEDFQKLKKEITIKYSYSETEGFNDFSKGSK